MYSLGRAVILGVIVTLGVVLGASLMRVSAQASDPRSGTWKLNLEKSKYDPGPAPQSNTTTIEASSDGETATTKGVNSAGTATGPWSARTKRATRWWRPRPGSPPRTGRR